MRQAWLQGGTEADPLAGGDSALERVDLSGVIGCHSVRFERRADENQRTRYDDGNSSVWKVSAGWWVDSGLRL